jgi:hypothetical protein
VFFLPSIIVREGDIFHFDKRSGKRIIVWKPPITSPYYSVLVYQLNSNNFSILYKTRFYAKHRIGLSTGLYKTFILFHYKSTQTRWKNVFYDITKGTFEGKVVIPRKDACHRLCYTTIGFGWHGKIAIHIEREGVKLYVTIYDSVESNITGYLNLILRNGISIHYNNTAYISKEGDIYDYDMDNDTITVYIRQIRYKPVKHVLIRHPSCMYYQRWHAIMRLDILSDTIHIMCIPGPAAIAFPKRCIPVDGIVEKGAGNMIFRELIPSIHPSTSNATDVSNFFFSMDGPLLHLIRNPKKTDNVKEHLLAVDIYTGMRS